MATAAQWSTLPGDILIAITKLLNTDTDLLCLLSICSHWRSSLPPPRKPFSFPLKVPSLRSLLDWCSPNGGNGYFVLHQTSLYRLSPPEFGPSAGDASDGWLFKVTETNPNTFSLLVPLSTDRIKCSPGMLPNHLNLLNYRISEISKSHTLEFVDPDNTSEKSSPIYIVRKVIVLWNYVADCVLAVLVLRHGGGMDYWRFGDEEWTKMDTGGYHFQDLILFDGKCYAIASTGVLVSFDSELNLTEVESSSVTMGCEPSQQNYLVGCKSDLYVVSKISSPEPEFYYDYAEEWPVVDPSSINLPLKINIFKKKCGDWVYLRSLGDTVLFLGDDVSFGVSAEDFGGFKGNCIFLTDECFYDDGVGSVFGDDIGVYDLDLRSVKSLVMAQDYAKLFWPPPNWLNTTCASSSGL